MSSNAARSMPNNGRKGGKVRFNEGLVFGERLRNIVACSSLRRQAMGGSWSVDHVVDKSSAIQDDSLLAELSHTPGTMALHIFVADSDDLILLLIKDGEAVVNCTSGMMVSKGALEPWQHLLIPGRSTHRRRAGDRLPGYDSFMTLDMAGNPAIMVERMVAQHLEILRGVRRALHQLRG